MKVLRYQAHNFMRLSDLDVTLDGYHLFIVGGGNGQGKSSALLGLKSALCGKSGIDDYPDVSLREGEDEGWVKLDLGNEATDYTVELYLKRKRGGQVIETFRVTDSKGRECPAPRALLQRLFNLRGFDPLAFEKLPKKQQRDLLLKVLGLDFTQQKAEYDRLYKEREQINREGKATRARFDAMPQHRDVPDEEVSVESLMAELKQRQAHNAENQKRAKAYTDAVDAAAWATNDLDAAVSEVERIRVLLAKAELEVRECRSRMEHARGQADELFKTVEKMKDADCSEIEGQIAASGEVNRKVRENAQRKATEASLEQLRAQSQHLSDEMAAITHAMQSELEHAQWPIPGLSVDDEGVLFNGLPFGQAAKSTRILTSAKIGMALNPSLRLMVCEAGSDLDTETIEALDQILEEGDFQAVVELVTRGESDEDLCQVVIENGAAKKRKVSAPCYSNPV